MSGIRDRVLGPTAVATFGIGVVLSVIGLILRPPTGFLFFGGILMLVGGILFFVLFLISWQDEDD